MTPVCAGTAHASPHECALNTHVPGEEDDKPAGLRAPTGHTATQRAHNDSDEHVSPAEALKTQTEKVVAQVSESPASLSRLSVLPVLCYEAFGGGCEIESGVCGGRLMRMNVLPAVSSYLSVSWCHVSVSVLRGLLRPSHSSNNRMRTPCMTATCSGIWATKDLMLHFTAQTRRCGRRSSEYPT